MPSTMQGMQCVQVFLAQPNPPGGVPGRPEIAGQAADKALAAVVDLSHFLIAVVAPTHVATLSRSATVGAGGLGPRARKLWGERLDRSVDVVTETNTSKS